MDLLALLAALLLIAVNAFFVIAEYALVTAKRSRLRHREESGDRGARIALGLMDDPVRFIGTVQIGITAVGVLLGAVSRPAVEAVVGQGAPDWLSYALGFLLSTYLAVAFGELVPKALALHRPEPVAAWVARPVAVLSKLFAPGVWILQGSAALVLRPLGVPPVIAGEGPVSRDELIDVVAEAEDAGNLDADEEDMVTAALRMRTREVREVMRPWEVVESISLTLGDEGVCTAVAESAHSRLPVRDADEGDVVGFLHARDVWRAERSGMAMRDVLRDPVRVPAGAALSDALRELREHHQELAIVTDGDRGEPVGIATIEDIVEEIVGDIEDEFDVRQRDVDGAGRQRAGA